MLKLHRFQNKKEDIYFPPGKSNDIDGSKGNLSRPQTAEEDKPKSPVHRGERRMMVNADMDPEQMKELASRLVENQEVEVVCNGIRYKGLSIEIETLPELICEECEKEMSLIKCEACNQVFCNRCFTLCHQRSEMGTILHPHEYTKMVRPIRHGDSSSIHYKEKFELPDYECHEREFSKNKDISKPNALIANQTTAIVHPIDMEMSCKKLMFSIGDTVVFADPLTKKQMFGEVVSDWDMRNGQSAPTLIRGEGGGITWYVVESVGLLTPDILQELEKLEPVEITMTADDDEDEKLKLQQPTNIPVLEGVCSSRMHLESVMAHQIDKRLAQSQYVKEFGPVHHLNPPRWNAQDSYKRITTANLGSRSATRPGAKNRLNNDNVLGDEGSGGGISQKKVSAPIVLGAKKEIVSVHASSRTIAEAANAAILACSDKGVSLEVVESFSKFLLPPEPQNRIQKENRILTLPENALIRPRDQFKLNLLMKNNRLRTILNSHFAKFANTIMKWGFSVWQNTVYEMVFYARHNAAVIIQKLIRRFLCKYILNENKLLKATLLKDKWKKVHQRFNYATANTLGAISYDQKIFFASHRDLNKYSFYIRKEVVKCVTLLTKKRFHGMKHFFGLWLNNITVAKISELKIFHLRDYDVDGTNYNHVVTGNSRYEVLNEAKERAKHDKYTELVHKTYQEEIGDLEKMSLPLPGHSSIHSEIDIDGYQKIGTMPMARDRDPSGFGPASYHPNLGFSSKNLPSLPNLPDHIYRSSTIGATEQQISSTAEKQKYNSFRSKQEGPTDHTCWIIPNRLLMGRIPLGKARKKGFVDSSLHTQVDCMSQILVAGITDVISLLPEDEELEEIKQYNNQLQWYDKALQTIELAAVSGHNQAKNTFRSTISNLNQVVEQKSIEMEHYSHMERHDIRFPEYEKKRIELKAKRKVALDNIARAKKDLNKLSSRTPTWKRYPLEYNVIPPLDRIVPIIWRLEEKLYRGENLFIYSREGHGRAALICGCILGRLYGLSITDTLLRLQTYHDCQRGQREREVSINCPQMRAQQEMLGRILKISNYVYEGITYRTQVDPETVLTSHQYYQSGTLILDNIKNIKEEFHENQVTHEKKSLYLAPEIPAAEIYVSDVAQNGSGNIDLYDPNVYSTTLKLVRELPTVRIPETVSPTLKKPGLVYKEKREHVI